MKTQAVGDKLAIGISVLCMLHCLLLPLALILLPAATGLALLNHELVHEGLLFAIIPISVVALLAGYRHHGSLPALLFGSIGMLLLIGAVLVAHEQSGEIAEIAMTVIGSVLLIYGHVVNYKQRAVGREISA